MYKYIRKTHSGNVEKHLRSLKSKYYTRDSFAAGRFARKTRWKPFLKSINLFQTNFLFKLMYKYIRKIHLGNAEKYLRSSKSKYCSRVSFANSRFARKTRWKPFLKSINLFQTGFLLKLLYYYIRKTHIENAENV